MAISELLEIVPPPENPVEAQNGEAWKRAQQVLGIELPEDFREFGVQYGSGTFCGGYLTVNNPLSVGFDDFVTFELETLRDNKASRNFPYEVFPDQPGLIPWGGDENGHMLHWLTEGVADNWLVVIESHEGDFEQFDMSMTTFLAKALSNEIRPKHIWGEPFEEKERTFTSKRT